MFETTIGSVKVPNIHLFARGNYDIDDIVLNWSAQPFKLPDELQAVKQKLVEENQAKAKAANRPFFDGPIVRLYDYAKDGNKLHLFMQPTSYFTFQATNVTLDQLILENGTKSIREKYIQEPYSLVDPLSNAIGVDTIIVTGDNYMIYSQRSNKVNIYPNTYHVLTAGMMHPEKDFLNEGPNPLATGVRETWEEAGIKLYEDSSPKFDASKIDWGKIEYNMLALGRDWNTLHIEVINELRTNLTAKEIEDVIATKPPKHKYEHAAVHKVKFDPKTVLTDEKFKDTQKWVPAGVVGILLSLEKEYGADSIRL